ncbi:predicted protein [Naegleria gruberi]|uniref:Predicted protein n=1 Tax=Naegleria gruberi TaxID=5762 RepID=D2W0D8_NAEGR|nr:uncharacterized protein NAEGRDRAFT_53702 [Naegleria gruberi]EFC37456.1 predicted protein [Naegleria gruberi]|eukprot:XP_002670200.1 predicted protein [Naegleria gruberi strain NEG-M]
MDKRKKMIRYQIPCSALKRLSVTKHACLSGNVVRFYSNTAAKLDGQLEQHEGACPFAGNHSKEKKEVKPYSSIPGPKGYPLIGDALEFFKHSQNSQAYFEKLVKEYGEVVKFELLGANNVILSNPIYVKEVAQQDEGRFYVKGFRQVKLDENMIMAPVEMKPDENWQDVRSLFNIAMRPDLSESISLPQLTQLNSGFMNCLIEHLKKTENIQSTMNQIQDEDFKKSIANSPVFQIVNPTQFISRYTFNAVSKVFLGANFYDKSLILPFDRDLFVKDALRFLDIGTRTVFDIPFFKYLRRKDYLELKTLYVSIIERCKMCINLFTESNPSGMPRLKELIEEKAKEYERGNEMATITLSSFLLAGVDITARVMAITMYRIAHETKYQEKLYEELVKVFGEPSIDEITNGNLLITAEQFKKLKFCRNFIDESMRLNHVIDTSSLRVLSKDLEIAGYKIPKGSFVHFFESPKYSEKFIPHSMEFIPERYEKSHECRPINNYVHNPFGLGARKCPGSRVATTEILFSLINIVRHFRLVHENPNEFPKMETDQSMFYIDMNKNPVYFIPRDHVKPLLSNQ